MTTDENSSWWDFLEEAQDQRRQIQALLAGPTLSEEELDDVSSALAYIEETIKTAREGLGLS